MNRREALKALGGGAVALGTGKAVDNVLIGYGDLTGTNLLEQDLAAVADEHFGPSERYDRAIGDHRVLHQQETLFVVRDDAVVDTLSVPNGDPEEAVAMDERYGLNGALHALLNDIRALRDGSYRFEFHTFDAFFERVASGTPRPYAADVLRGPRAGDPETVESFAGAPPNDPKGVLAGLVEAFRDHTDYDVPRYVAGSITDNVLLKAVRLRKYFRDPVDFDSLAAQQHAGMFCYEFTHRSMEAAHAVPAFAQSPPVVTAKVRDYRHKHVYTGVASVLRDDDGLVIPMTFVDYTHTTLYDDFALTGVLGEGFEAYGERHRADEIFWHV